MKTAIHKLLLILILAIGFLHSAFAVKDSLLLNSYGVQNHSRGFTITITSLTINVGDTLVFSDQFAGTNNFSIVDSVTGAVQTTFNGLVANKSFTYVAKSDDIPKFFVYKGLKSLITITVKPVTGISEVLNNIQFNMFPNPASSQITVQPSFEYPLSVLLINLLGQLLFEEKFQVGSKITIDLRSLPKGIYVLHLLDLQNNFQGQQKLIVQ